MKILKTGEIIKGIDFSVEFYARLQMVALLLSNPEELVNMKDDAPEEYADTLQTMLILLNTLDKAAENQGLISNVIPPEE